MIQEEDLRTIQVGDKHLLVKMLPQEVQDLINIHELWVEQLETAKLEVFKLEAALRGLMTEIEVRVSSLGE
jgi:hypothetical protein